MKKLLLVLLLLICAKIVCFDNAVQKKIAILCHNLDQCDKEDIEQLYIYFSARAKLQNLLHESPKTISENQALFTQLTTALDNIKNETLKEDLNNLGLSVCESFEEIVHDKSLSEEQQYKLERKLIESTNKRCLQCIQEKLPKNDLFW